MTDHAFHEADELFLSALRWLGQTYGDNVFYVERDIVYTLQTKLNQLIETSRTGWTVYNDYPMIPGPRRHLSSDLAILDLDRQVAVAIELKYEPCHRRHDVLRSKLPVTSWSEIVKDTARIRDFVEQGHARVGYAICIDEGNYLAKRDLRLYGEQLAWDAAPRHAHPVSALVHRFPL